MSYLPLPVQTPHLKIPMKGPLGSSSDLTTQDRLFALAAILKGDHQTAMQIPMLAAARRQQAEQQAATSDLARFASGQPVPQRADLMRAMDPENAAPPDPQDDAPVGGMGLAPRISVPQVKIPTRSPQADAMGGPVTMRGALPMLAKLAMAGGDPSKWVTMLKEAQPEIAYERGVRYDRRDPSSAPAEIIDLEKGQQRLYDSDGRLVGVKNADGYVQSIAELEGAKANATERARAGYDIVQVPMSNGRVVSLPRLSAVERLGGGAGGGGNAGGSAGGGAEFGVSQSPAEAAADKKRADAQADAQIDLPRMVQDADQALALIDTIKANPALKDRTGLKSLLPALPGSPGAAFDAAHDQLAGKLFMQAYAGLKGGGQITEIEGKKATQAIARLARNQSADDYIAALNDLADVVKAGRDRAMQQAQRPDLTPGAHASSGHPPAPPAAQRQPNAIYQTPRGPMQWTGTGWLPAN